MNEAFTTDWKGIGLPDRSPFDILRRPRAEPKPTQAPKKRGPKKTQREKVLASLRDPGEATRNAFNVDLMTRAETDRTNAIRFGSSI